MDLNLTSEEWAELYALRHSDTASAPVTDSALDKVLAHRPKPVLEDGIWESPLGNLYRVRAGEFVGFGTQLMPSDPSGWTPLRVLADDEVAVKLDGYFVAPDGYGDPAIWREREGKDPVPALYRYYATSGLFDVLAAALPHRDDEADR